MHVAGCSVQKSSTFYRVCIWDAYSHLITLLWASINSSHITHSFLKCTHSESFFHNFIQHFFMHIKTYQNKNWKAFKQPARQLGRHLPNVFLFISLIQFCIAFIFTVWLRKRHRKERQPKNAFIKITFW